MSATASKPGSGWYLFSGASVAQVVATGQRWVSFTGGLENHRTLIPDPDAPGGRRPPAMPPTAADAQALHDGKGVLDRAPQDNRNGTTGLVVSNAKSVSVYEYLFTRPEAWEKRAAERRALVFPELEAVARSGEVGAVRQTLAETAAYLAHHCWNSAGEPSDHFHLHRPNCATAEPGGAVLSVRNDRDQFFRAAEAVNARCQKLLSDWYAGQGVKCELWKDNCHVSAIPKEACDLVSTPKQIIEALKKDGVVPDTRKGEEVANYHARIAADVRVVIPKGATREQLHKLWSDTLDVRVERANPDLPPEKKIDLKAIAADLDRQRSGPPLGPKTVFEAKAGGHESVRASVDTLPRPATAHEWRVHAILSSVGDQKAPLAEVERNVERSLKNPKDYGMDKLSLKKEGTGEPVELFGPKEMIAQFREQLLARREERLERAEPTKTLPVPDVERQPARLPEPEKAPPPMKPEPTRVHPRPVPPEPPDPKPPKRTWGRWLREKMSGPELKLTISADREVERFLLASAKGSKFRAHLEAAKAILRRWHLGADPNRVAEAGTWAYERVRAYERLRPGMTLVVDNRNGELTAKERSYLDDVCKRDGAKLDVRDPEEPERTIRVNGKSVKVEVVPDRDDRRPPPPPPPPLGGRDR